MNEHRDLLGVPWIDGGRDPAVGLDCVGVVLVALHRRGYPTPDHQVRVGQRSTAETFHRWFDPVETPEPGDVLLVWAPLSPGGALEHHVGLLLDRGLVLGSTASGVALLPVRAFLRHGLIGAHRPRMEPRP